MSRNHINVLASDGVVARPGGAGTDNDADRAVRYGRPILAYLETAGQIPGLPTDIPVVRSVGEVEVFLKSALGLS